MSKHKHLFPIVDEFVNSAIRDIEAEGDRVTCQKGCDHCCHLLIEIAWEEALELCEALQKKEPTEHLRIISSIRENAREAKEFFMSVDGGHVFARPVRGEVELPDNVYDAYFFDKKRPCPFLSAGCCTVYESRPTACRLHVVTSEPQLCANDVKEDEEYCVPEQIETAKEEVAPTIEILEKDGRWGHFGIVLEAAVDHLIETGEINLDSLKALQDEQTVETPEVIKAA